MVKVFNNVILDHGYGLHRLLGAYGVQLIPPEYLYQDYTNPLLVAWNWSFMPINIFISLTGFYSLYLLRRRRSTWIGWSIISLVFTFSSGLLAISLWSIRLDFDPMWWTPNLFLMVFPMFFMPRMLKMLAASKV